MGLVFYDVASYKAALDLAITDSLGNGGMLDEIKQEVGDVVQDAVDSYSPIFESRRGKGGGGVADPSNMTEILGLCDLSIHFTAGWQSIGFRHTTGAGVYGDLSDVINGSGMYHAPARPFVEMAEEKMKDIVEQRLPGELLKRGF